MERRVRSLVALGALALFGCSKDFQTTPSGGDAGPSGTGVDASGQTSVPKDGLALWLAADKGVIQASGRVTIWEDQSGNHMDAVQSASNAQPKLGSFTSGRKGVEFDGQGAFMRLPSGFSDFSKGVSIFVVANSASVSSCSGILEFSNGEEVDDIHFGRETDQLHYEVYNSSHTGGDSPPDVAQEMAVVHRTDQTVELRRNGTIADTDTFELPVVNPRNSTFVGKTLYASCVLYQGLIGEILVYERAVTDREVLGIESYLRGRWSCCTE